MAEKLQDHGSRLIDVLRDAYLRRRTGRILINGGSEVYLRRGELYLDRDDDLASGLSPLVARAGQLERPMADAEMRSAVERLAAALLAAGGSEAEAEWTDQAPAGVELLGPMPAIGVLLVAAVHGGDEAVLLERLGGEKTRFSSCDETPAMGQLPRLDADMARVLVLLEQPAPVKGVLRGGGDRLATLTGLAKLWAVGLAEKPDARRGGESNAVVDDKMLQRFLVRIAENLELEPLTVEAASHRSRLAELIGTFGDLDHYQLLGVEPAADDAAISAAYDRLARLAHPKHAAAVGLSGKEGALKLLFERATEAYLTLCDPLRRSSYNTLMGIHSKVEVDASTRDEEKRFVARQSFLQATSALSEADYSTAIDLLKESVRIDPKPEYYAMLGQAQAKNPHWRRYAVDAYRQAVDLAPDNAGYHLALGKLLEKLDELAEAKEHYEAAVDLMPDNVDALEGLTRLRGTGGGKAAQSLRSVLGRKR